MKRLILPIILVLLGTGSGVAAGKFLGGGGPAVAEEDCAVVPLADAEHAVADDHAAVAESTAEDHPATPGREYARLNNQFVIPIVTNGGVNALVVLSISVEVDAGQKDRVFEVEPLLRDIFLQVLFDHANTGGFDGVFTATATMRNLRLALQRAVEASMPGFVKDVLIVDIVRQDN